VGVARRAAAMKADGIDVLDFSVGEPDFASPIPAIEAAHRALAAGRTRYAPASGLPVLRQVIAARYRKEYGAPWGAEEALVTVGAKTGLFELALALFEEGDEVVLPTPTWASFAEQVRFASAAVVEVPTRPEEGFAIHAAPLLAACSPLTRAVILNSPCNPTGAVIPPAELSELAAGCAARGVLLIADETYEQLVYDAPPASAAALAAELPETVIVVGSFSKSFAMTGWRVGYLLGPAEVVDAVARIQSHGPAHPATFAMFGALAAWEESQGEVERMRSEYRARRDWLIPRLDSIPGVRCALPAGAFYAFPDISAHFRPDCAGSIAFANWLLDDAHIAVVPGQAFGADHHVRLSFACGRDLLERGCDRLGELLRRVKP